MLRVSIENGRVNVEMVGDVATITAEYLAIGGSLYRRLRQLDEDAAGMFAAIANIAFQTGAVFEGDDDEQHGTEA